MSKFDTIVSDVLNTELKSTEVINEAVWGSFNYNKKFILKTPVNVLHTSERKKGRNLTRAYGAFEKYVQYLRSHPPTAKFPSIKSPQKKVTDNDIWAQSIENDITDDNELDDNELGEDVFPRLNQAVYEATKVVADLGVKIHIFCAYYIRWMQKKAGVTSLHDDFDHSWVLYEPHLSGISRIEALGITKFNKLRPFKCNVSRWPGDTSFAADWEPNLTHIVEPNHIELTFPLENPETAAELKMIFNKTGARIGGRYNKKTTLDNIYKKGTIRPGGEAGEKLKEADIVVYGQPRVIDSRSGIVMITPASRPDLLGRNINDPVMIKIYNEMRQEEGDIKDFESEEGIIQRYYDDFVSDVEINPFDEEGNLVDWKAFLDAVQSFVKTSTDMGNIGFYVQSFVRDCWQGKKVSIGGRQTGVRPSAKAGVIHTAARDVPPAIAQKIYQKVFKYIKKYFGKYLMYMTPEDYVKHERTLLSRGIEAHQKYRSFLGRALGK